MLFPSYEAVELSDLVGMMLLRKRRNMNLNLQGKVITKRTNRLLVKSDFFKLASSSSLAFIRCSE